MTRKTAITFLLSFILAIALSSSVHAATYSFSQDRMVANVFIDANGTMSIDYTIDFTNDTGVSPIDYVDVVLPNSNYDLSSISASVNGHTITDIQKSDYVSIGVALGLGGNAIQPGTSGRVVVHVGSQGRMIYAYTKQL
jgi:hypothetical protein